MSAPTRGYGISTQDMKADRLVFVSLANAKPRRKLAVPVPDTFTWEQFLQQVATKLKISKVRELRLAASGEKIERLEDLQDIDELYVTEADAQIPNGSAGHLPISSNAPLPGPSSSHLGVAASPPQPSGNAMSPPPPAQPISRTISHDRRRPNAAFESEISPAAPGSSGREYEEDSKYARRPVSVRQSLSRWMPRFFPPSLPVTSRDVDKSHPASEGKSAGPGRKRRRKRQSLTARLGILFALMALLGTLLYMYGRLMPHLPALQQ
ncbi:hypothetical protein WJX74_010467 [Apatococcus lobatus]|uniref:Ubiquitin-like domain-containing protein n=2 Tax=Apatococcus TaxID=904362 RepID=A0AAW1SRS4_9CHLO